MITMLHKFKKRQFVQNSLIEAVADVLMVAVGIIVAYYIKTQMF